MNQEYNQHVDIAIVSVPLRSRTSHQNTKKCENHSHPLRKRGTIRRYRFSMPFDSLHAASGTASAAANIHNKQNDIPFRSIALGQHKSILKQSHPAAVLTHSRESSEHNVLFQRKRCTTLTFQKAHLVLTARSIHSTINWQIVRNWAIATNTH